MTYDFYVFDESIPPDILNDEWYGVTAKGNSYWIVGLDNGFESDYPINNDPNNWINTVEHHKETK